MSSTETDAPAEPDVVATLVARRKQLGLRQKDVAQLMGVGQPAVCLFEHHTKEPRLSTVMRYARAVGATVAVEIEPGP